MEYPTTILHRPKQKGRFAPSDRAIKYIRKDMYDALVKILVKHIIK